MTEIKRVDEAPNAEERSLSGAIAQGAAEGTALVVAGAVIKQGPAVVKQGLAKLGSIGKQAPESQQKPEGEHKPESK